MEFIKIKEPYNDCLSHIQELDQDIYLITNTFMHNNNLLLYQNVLDHKKKFMLSQRQLEIQFKKFEVIQKSMVGHCHKSSIICFIGTQSGKLFKIMNGQCQEFTPSSVTINTILLLDANYLAINSDIGQINIMDVHTCQTIFIFNEFMSSPINYFKIRHFSNQIVQAKQDGLIIFFELSEKMRIMLQDHNFQNQQDFQPITISQSFCKLYVVGVKLIDFDLYGELILALTQFRLDVLAINHQERQYIRIKSFKLNLSYLNVDVCYDKFLLYAKEEINFIDPVTQEIKILLGKKGYHNKITIFFENIKIHYI